MIPFTKSEPSVDFPSPEFEKWLASLSENEKHVLMNTEARVWLMRFMWHQGYVKAKQEIVEHLQKTEYGLPIPNPWMEREDCV